MDLWFARGLSFLPIFVIVWSYLTFTISFVMSVARGDVDPGFPYISDTGAKRPESCVFGQMLNIAAAAAFLTLYVRYKQVHCFLIKLPDEKVRSVSKINKVALFLAVLIALGMSLVANFQENSLLAMHITGAMMCFGLGTVYAFLHSYISYKMNPEVNSRTISHVRLVMSFFCLAFLLTTSLATFGVNAPIKFHWTPEDTGYAAHLASTIAEWLLAATFLGYFYTFIKDFQIITFDLQPTVLRNDLHHNCDINNATPTQIRPEERTPLIA